MALNAPVDYPALAKGGFFLGLALLAVGGGGELVGHALYGTLPAWEDALLFDLEVIGLLLFALSPFVFGIVLPLVE